MKHIVCTALGMIEVYLNNVLILYAKLKKFLDIRKVPLNKLIGIGTDGARKECRVNHSLFTVPQDNGLPYFHLFKCLCHSLTWC
ncbi:hypothetical protein QYM36_018859 [Artemia franciscana]|uniref:Uncharacterized protein n=1 Tax=Artemia franciscana TaxID=6661 RepID=A0AA88H631_ARTSF|nr:hypothetical protein QYM36_018859 [Artemia franciscana]